MYFSHLELHGFKSFAEHTLLEFQPGITTIVGPNGCGKSNVMDALRWVLGEQSTKTLRSNQMEDVIFNGSDSLRPLGMVEVSLKLENRGSLPVDYDEVLITRRLYRSGDSEYYLNKASCRLKDITDLFLDTGVGHKAYSLVEQGKVDQLLLAKPSEHRLFIEEAAGIMKYKQRKKEALSKMEQASQNLLRIGDVIGEVRKQLDSVDKQARRARRYKTLMQQERELSLQLACLDYLKFQAEWQALETQLQELRDKEAQAAAELARQEVSTQEARLSILKAQEELSAIQKQLYDQELVIKRSEDRINHLRENLSSLDEQQRQLGQESEQLQGQHTQLGHSLEECKIKLEQDEQNLQACRERYQKQQAELREQEQLLAKTQSQMDSARNQMMSLISGQSQIKNNLASLEAYRHEAARRQGRLNLEKETATAEQGRLQQKLAETGAELAKVKQNLTEQAQREAYVKEQLLQQGNLLKQKERLLAELRHQLELKNSQWQSLRDMQGNLEGFQQGVRALMRAKQQNTEEFSGLYEVVGRQIVSAPQYELALEAVLAHRLGYIIVEKPEDAIAALRFLKQKKAGRASFLPKTTSSFVVQTFRSAPGVDGQSGADLKVCTTKEEKPGWIGPALEFVQCQPDCESLVKYLLAKVALVEDLDVALAIRSNYPDWTLVTLAGEVLGADGVITGGTPEAAQAGILPRNRKIQELRAEITVVEQQYQASGQEVDALHKAIAELNHSQETIHAEKRQTELDIIRYQHTLEQQQKDLSRISRQLETLQMEDAQLKFEDQEKQQRQAGWKQKLVEIEGQEQQLKQSMGQTQETQEQQTQLVNDLRQQCTRQQIELAGLEEKVNSGRKEAQRLVQAQEANVCRITDVQGRLKAIQAKQQEIRQESEQIDKTLAVMREQYRQLKESWAVSNEGYIQKSGASRQEEVQYKEKKELWEKLRQELNNLELDTTRAKLKLDQLTGQITAHFNLAIEHALAQAQAAAAEQPRIQERLARLKEQIAEMGDVNLMAIEEQKLLQERFEFLQKQRQDLEESVNQLHQVIAKINSTTRERFQETFEAVNQKFSQLYPQLFGGGMAELRLEEGKNLLEAGVEILVQPPGKKLQNLALLSGGEKTMTAIAFLFSIYMVKPSPICFLDEVDAALDEANVSRLAKMLKEFTQHSQFVVITHNKRTMEAADVMYGITMEQPGVSKIVSVKLNGSNKA